MEIPIGVHAFTADGVQVGAVVAVSEGAFEIEVEGGELLRLPDSLAGGVEAGKLVLELTAEAMRAEFALPLDGAVADASPREHLPADAVDALWDGLQSPSWGELARAVDAEADGDMEPTVLADVGRVAQEMEERGEPFPGDRAEFQRVIQLHAETMAHESS